MISGTIIGILLHAIGGIAAATCYVPQRKTPRWSYQTYWLVFCTVGWLIVPIVFALLTVPNLGGVIAQTPSDVLLATTMLGVVYGFGGMAFALSIRYIGFSLTYSIAIGISAVLGTVIPALLDGVLIESFSKAGSSWVLFGFLIAMVGVAFCGYAGLQKERELNLNSDSEKHDFDIKTGMVLVIIAGVLSSVFGLALAAGEPIDKIAAEEGAGDFQAGAKYIFAMGGAFLTNLVWWSVVHFRRGSFGEFGKLNAANKEQGSLLGHYVFGALSGILWYGQFLFYGLGHLRMGDFQFISWGIHMSMLIFFSFGIGFLLKEWAGLRSGTVVPLYIGLSALISSFALITYGSSMGG